MDYLQSSREIRKTLAKYSNTQPDDWFLCLKARFGLAVVLKCLHDNLGSGEIITTSYTCITAINPIIVAGFKPIYADIEPSTLSINIPPKTLLNTRTKAIVMQHTLGIIGDKTALADFATEHNLLLIEDAAHCLTRMARDKNNKILADVSVHSFGVEKILTGTKFGGAIYINPELKKKNSKLYNDITTALLALKQPNQSTAFRVRTYRFNNALLQRAPHNLKYRLRDASIKAKLLEPAIFPYEQEGKQAKPVTTNSYVNRIILNQLASLKANYNRRERNVKLYKNTLSSSKFRPITATTEPLLAYPIYFEDINQANKAYDMLMSSNFFIRRWYSPLLYPGPKSNRIYHYSPQATPIAEETSKHILCLPTDLPMNATITLINLLNSPVIASK